MANHKICRECELCRQVEYATSLHYFQAEIRKIAISIPYVFFPLMELYAVQLEVIGVA